MDELMVKLRKGMDRRMQHQQLRPRTLIVQSIQSFALYGFPESHAASFALIAYASAYFKVKYLAAFTCAMLNNQPMGFYTPAVLVKDAQRHLPSRKALWMSRCPDTVCTRRARGLRPFSFPASRP